MQEDDQIALFAGINNQKGNYSPEKKQNASSQNQGQTDINDLLGLDFSTDTPFNQNSQGNQGIAQDPFINLNTAKAPQVKKPNSSG